jgi:hypothetical protein
MDEGQTPDSSVPDLNTNLDGAPEELTSVPAGFSVLGTTRQSPQGYRYTGATVVSMNWDPSWQPIRTELPHPGRVVCVSIEDKVYALWDSGEVWAYDPESPPSSAWSPRANMPGPRRYAFGVGVLDKKIYVVGGFDSKGFKTDRVEEYDLEDDMWSQRAPLPTSRSHLVVASLGGRLYAVGGKQTRLRGLFKNWTTAVNEEYHPVSDTWFSRKRMPTARHAAGAGTVNGRMSVLGGERRRFLGLFGMSKTDRNERYSPSDDTWIQDSPMPSAKSHFGAGVVNRRIYVSGGQGTTGRTAGTETYDPISRNWSEESLMDLARSSHGVCVFDGAILALGGETPHGQTDSAEAFPVQTIFHVHRKNVMEKAEETEMLPAESLSPGSRMFSRHEDLPPSPSVSPKDVNWGRLVVMAILVLATACAGMLWKTGPSLDGSILNDYFVNANPSPKAPSPPAVKESPPVWAVVSSLDNLADLYANPSTQSERISVLKNGTMWQVLARSDDDAWVYLKWREKSVARPGWISVGSVELPKGAMPSLPVR